MSMQVIEQKLNSVLQRFPGVKRGIKRCYQRVMYAISPKLKSEGDIVRISPEDEYEYLFGYYDKCPWDSSGRYMLCMRVADAHSQPDNDLEAQLVTFDTARGNAMRIFGVSHSWNVQQGCMLQWLGSDAHERVIWNDFRGGSYCAVIHDMTTGAEWELPMPVYAVSPDGSFALTLDFSRLHRLRPGYGYCNLPDGTADEPCPDKPCIWREDLQTGNCVPVLKYTDLAAFEPRPEMRDAVHKVNHIMIAPDGRRMMFLHRWFAGTRKYTRLLTANCDGSGLWKLLDDDLVSHCCWKNEREILSFAEKKGEGRGYFLLRDKTHECRRLWPSLVGDGHPSYGPDGRVVTDTYPDRRRVSCIYLLDERSDETPALARVFTPFRYDNETRCDLHPRWSRDGTQICFDAAFEGRREMYVLKAGREEK